MRWKSHVVWLVVICAVLCCALPMAAQEYPKAELFAGYSFLRNDVGGNSPHTPYGFGVGATGNFNRWVGLQADFSYNNGKSFNDGYNWILMFGPKFTLRGEHVMPFAEGLFGASKVRNFNGAYQSTAWGGMVGVGVDWKVAKHLALRVPRVDLVAQRFRDGSDFGPRVEAGLVFLVGTAGEAKMTPTAACSVSPTEVLAGEPVTATASASQFNPKRTLTYSWKTTGGKAAGAATSTQIDTTGLAPGAYTVSAHVTDGKKAMADCNSQFTVKEPPKHPPTITCSADRSTVVQGSPIAVSCQGNSEDKRPLTYSWQSSCGNIAGNGANGTLTTTGVTGPCTVTTTVTDDRGLTASTTTNVTVQAPPPPPPPPAPEPGSAAAIRQDLANTGKALLNVHFDTNKATIRPESEPLLTNSAQVLQEDPSLFIYVDGYTDSRGSNALNLNLSRRRAASVKTWLTQHGIEANRMISRGFGKANPVGDNNTEAGRQANRRVELVKMTDAEKAKAAAAPKAAKKKVVKKAATKK